MCLSRLSLIPFEMRMEPCRTMADHYLEGMAAQIAQESHGEDPSDSCNILPGIMLRKGSGNR